MRFNLVDRILEIEPGRMILAAKNLTLGEEYLADHFPTFPVMPGVLMLQTLVEAGAWLIRVSEGFRHSTIVMRETKNVKYGQFVIPGQELRVTAELLEDDGRRAILKGRGEVEGAQTVTARFGLERYNLAEKNPELAVVDQNMMEEYRRRYVSMINPSFQAKNATTVS